MRALPYGSALILFYGGFFMKKQLTTLLALTLSLGTLLAFTACGNRGGGGEGGGNDDGGKQPDGGEQTHSHAFTHENAVDPTCVKEGRAEYWYCSGCGKYFSDGEGKTEISASSLNVPATGLHRFIENVCADCDLEWIPTEGLEYTLDSETDTYTVSGIGTASGDVVIPYFYENKLVTAIGKQAFNGCRVITGVAIPDSVTVIGVEAFNACTKLTGVTLPNNITEINTGTFLQCKALTRITIPESVTAIRNSAFNYCTKMTEISIPESVTEIGEFAFANCKALTQITLPSRVTSIPASLLYNASLLESITIPENVTEIGKSAFQNCAKLTRVTMGDKVTSLGMNAFYSCLVLTDVYYLGTQEKWEAIEKGENWDQSTGEYTVHYGEEAKETV